MFLSNEVKILFAIIVIAVIVYWYKCERKNSKSTITVGNGNVPQKQGAEHMTDIVPLELGQVDNENDDFADKLYSKNSTKGKYKKVVNYASTLGKDNDRELDKYFENIMGEMNGSSTGYEGEDVSGGQYAAYVSDKKEKKLSTKDKFDVERLMPKETNPDWFDTVYEPTSVAASNLISIHRPMGVNTTHSTLKNPTYDIRGEVPIPKISISPWNNSSIDPDMYSTGICGKPNYVV